MLFVVKLVSSDWLLLAPFAIFAVKKSLQWNPRHPRNLRSSRGTCRAGARRSQLRPISRATFGPIRAFRGKNRFIVLAIFEGATRSPTKNDTQRVGCHFEMIKKFFKELVSATEFLESGNSFVEHIKSGTVADADTVVITKCNTWDCSHTVAVEQLVTKVH